MLTKEEAMQIEIMRLRILAINLLISQEKGTDWRLLEVEGGVKKVDLEEYEKLANADGRKYGVFGKRLDYDKFQITPEELEEDLSKSEGGIYIIQEHS